MHAAQDSVCAIKRETRGDGVAPRVKLGLSFFFATSSGNAVGIVTAMNMPLGTLLWISEPLFQFSPGLDEVRAITDWRWPTFFHVSVNLHRGGLVAIGPVDIPPALSELPRMRNGGSDIGWRDMNPINGDLVPGEISTYPSLPIEERPNNMATLVKMIETDWRPEQDW
jgi:hypothetical protein